MILQVGDCYETCETYSDEPENRKDTVAHGCGRDDCGMRQEQAESQSD